MEFENSLFKNLIDERYGYISSLSVQKELFGQLYWARATSASRPSLPGFGVATNPDLAAIKASAEALERGYAFIPNECKPIQGSYSELSKLGKFQLLRPDRHVAYQDSQLQLQDFRLQNFDEGSCFEWIPMTDLIGNNTVYVPSDFVLLHKQSAKLHFPTTNGLAIAESEKQAQIGALLELIERDSVLCAWWSGISLRQFSPQKTMPVLSWLQSSCIRNFSFYVVPNEWNLPVVACVFLGDKNRGQPEVAFACSASFSWDQACEKSFFECYLVCALMQNWGIDRPLSVTGKWDKDIHKFEDGTLLYAQQGKELISSFLSNKRASDISSDYSSLEQESQVDLLLSRLLAQNYSPLFFNFNHSFLKDLNLSLVRSFVPGLLQLNEAHIYRNLGLPRLENYRKWASRMGYHASLQQNVKPHPIP